MNEDGVEFRYAGTDIVDLKEVEWIEFSDRDHRALRMAVEKSTHLPLRWVWRSGIRRRASAPRSPRVIRQFISLDGVLTPLSITRTQNGRRVTQTYLSSCKYNSTSRRSSSPRIARAALGRNRQEGLQSQQEKK